jgi:hypothetical protein
MERGAFIQPALFEAFGLTVIEAMVSGLPTFATCYGGPLEIIEHGSSGFHIDPNHGAKSARADSGFLRPMCSLSRNTGSVFQRRQKTGGGALHMETLCQATADLTLHLWILEICDESGAPGNEPLPGDVLPPPVQTAGGNDPTGSIKAVVFQAVHDPSGIFGLTEIDVGLIAQVFEFNAVVADHEAAGSTGDHILIVAGIARPPSRAGVRSQTYSAHIRSLCLWRHAAAGYRETGRVKRCSGSAASSL